MKFLRTPGDFGALIRERRKECGLDQAALAKHVAVSRQWIIELERGHPHAQLGPVLRVMITFGLNLKALEMPKLQPGMVNIDAIVEAHRRKRDA